jgi:hypothetical protein
MVTRTRLRVTLHVHCPFLNYIFKFFQDGADAPTPAESRRLKTPTVHTEFHTEELMIVFSAQQHCFLEGSQASPVCPSV